MDKTVEYPALIYKTRTNNTFVANCIMLNLIGFGRTEKEAISKLYKSLSEIKKGYSVTIKPLYSI